MSCCKKRKRTESYIHSSIHLFLLSAVAIVSFYVRYFVIRTEKRTKCRAQIKIINLTKKKRRRRRKSRMRSVKCVRICKMMLLKSAQALYLLLFELHRLHIANAEWIFHMNKNGFVRLSFPFPSDARKRIILSYFIRYILWFNNKFIFFFSSISFIHSFHS